jgi:putative membrane protein insertion efficiency factor
MSRAARAVIAVVQIYRQAVSPLRPPACRYTPTCSGYAVEALERFGLVRGGWLALRRVLRCHPFHVGGHDPVPSLVRDEDPEELAPVPAGRHLRPAA